MIPLKRLLAAAFAAGCLMATTVVVAAESTEDRLKSLESQVGALKKELAAAQGAGALPADRLAELERQIGLLSREIEKLRIGEAADDQPLASRNGLGPAASKVYRKEKGVSIGGYGEALYQNFGTAGDDGLPSGRQDTADLQRLVLYFGYKWNDSWLFNSEIEWEHATTGEGAEEKGEVSVEFANLEYLIREEASIRAGLVLIPVGFINELHEPPIYLGARRPDVERVIIPATWREVGVGAFGAAGPVSYRAYVVAGLSAAGFEASGIREGRQQGSNSVADDLALTGRVDWNAAPGLVLGGSFFTGNAGQGLQDLTAVGIDAKTTLLEGHVEWRWKGIEARGLYASTSIGDVARLNDALGFVGGDSIGERQAGWYAQAGFDVLTFVDGTEQSLVPFVRYEAYDTQRRVPAGFSRDGANDVSVKTIGLSWRPITHVVVKADYQDFDNRAGSGTDQWNLGLGFIF
jgi:hypothetical protein